MIKRISGVPEGYEPFVLKQFVQEGPILFVATNETKRALLQNLFKIIAPDIKILNFSAWDTVPYDRVAPAPEIVGNRINTLIELNQKKDPFILLTTASALLQRVPPPQFFKQNTFTLKVGDTILFNHLKDLLVKNGYHSVDVVMEMGSFAIRGGIIDIFPGGYEDPFRIDFFGDDIDSIRTFDPITQRTTGEVKSFTLTPMSEFLLTDETVSLFRSRFREYFDQSNSDTFYDAVSHKRYIQGLEHFLPFFHDHLVPLWDYIPKAKIVFDFKTLDAFQSRIEQIQEYYEARKQALENTLGIGSLYQPIPPNLLFLNSNELETFFSSHDIQQLTPFQEANTLDMGGRNGHDFVETRVQDKQDVFDSVSKFILKEKRKVIITASTNGSIQRISGLLRDRNINLKEAENFEEALYHSPSFLVAPFEKGFSTSKFIIITETDILGDRVIRPVKKRKNNDFIADITSLNIGDLVVHQSHGIGKFIGLIPLQIAGAAHDCLCVEYDGGDKLFIPVENADVLSRYGNNENASLDKLGSSSFATRKEHVKKDLFVMAQKLMDIASLRALKKTDKILAPHGLYQEFCAHFPYSETDDQARTIHEIENDLASGKPMDRLVCGDVGFGKTEVAMRAAFLALMNGYQVAVIVPTTLLARQHTQNFIERYQGFPVRIASLSRLVTPTQKKQVYKELEQGSIDIVIGTHALLSKEIHFKNLGLIIVDEEQHFGVTHKEQLKELKQGVHVLTLTATPIPRTLQLSLAGVRELSVIATPPVDRLAVKTFVTPFDPIIIKEALLREQFRGGQTFFVCPRISDMEEVSQILKKIVPDVRIVEAHGQMPASKLETIMTAFADKKYDVLLATSIIESGLDMPTVNTMIVYRADMFGLAALYQLRGRVGRGKLRAYTYLTIPPNQRLTDTAQKRLTVMQSLDSLGAGFALASHDLDIRGAGNLLGQEQSGHIREVGIALYQKMLQDAINTLRRDKGKLDNKEEDFSPQISVGIPVLIPETYIQDFDVRMSLYHRIGELTDLNEIESMRAELIDRFGEYPLEVENLFMTIELKILAKSVNIERLEAGAKGASVKFHNNTFPNPAGLIAYIGTQMGTIKIRPDQKLVIMRPWPKQTDRLAGIRNIIKKLSEICKSAVPPNSKHFS